MSEWRCQVSSWLHDLSLEWRGWVGVTKRRAKRRKYFKLEGMNNFLKFCWKLETLGTEKYVPWKLVILTKAFSVGGGDGILIEWIEGRIEFGKTGFNLCFLTLSVFSSDFNNFFVKDLFKSFTCFEGLFFSLLLTSWSSSHILDISPSWDKFYKYFSSIWPFSFTNDVFWKTKYFMSIKSNYQMSSFYSFC